MSPKIKKYFKTVVPLFTFVDKYEYFVLLLPPKLQHFRIISCGTLSVVQLFFYKFVSLGHQDFIYIGLRTSQILLYRIINLSMCYNITGDLSCFVTRFNCLTNHTQWPLYKELQVIDCIYFLCFIRCPLIKKIK